MKMSQFYQQDGYIKGFKDAKRTGGNIKQEIIDKYLNNETVNLPIKYSKAFIKGWHEGFNDGIEEIIFKSVRKDDFWEKHIYWENPAFSDR